MIKVNNQDLIELITSNLHCSNSQIIFKEKCVQNTNLKARFDDET